MKRILSALLSLSMAFTLTACGGRDAPAEDETTEVVVFAAASLEASLTRIQALYKAAAPNVTLTFNFDSSGTLRTQIRQGAVCHLFISAGQSQMDELDAGDISGKNTDGSDFVCPGTRIDLLENKVVLAVPEGDPSGIGSFQGLASDRLSLLCIANSDVPVGAYSLEILDALDLDAARLEAAGKITYASNVTEVANQVREGAVDCGIVYATDAGTHHLTVADAASSDLCGPVIYPAAVMKSGDEAAQAAARAFLDYLRTDDGAAAVLEGVGFTVLK